MKKLNRDEITLAICIALFPPIWAVLAPKLGVTTGAVALICAGVYAAAGNREELALPMSLAFLAGDGWAVLALKLMEALPLGESASLFVTLFFMGGVAVVIASLLPKLFFCPAWLCGWAIGLTILGPVAAADRGSLPVQIGAAMLAGVLYVGLAVERIRRRLAAVGRKE